MDATNEQVAADIGLNVVELDSYIWRLASNEFRRETLKRDHAALFRDYKGVAKEVVGELDGVPYAVVRDGQNRPRLTAELRSQRVLIDVATAAVLEGILPEPELSFARAVAKVRSRELARSWRLLERRAEAMDRLNRLADHVEALPEGGYDQRKRKHADGSPSCLVAHALDLFAPREWRRLRNGKPHEVSEAAEMAVGWLVPYYGRLLGWDRGSPNPREAAAMLRNIAEYDTAFFPVVQPLTGSGSGWRLGSFPDWRRRRGAS